MISTDKLCIIVQSRTINIKIHTMGRVKGSKNTTREDIDWFIEHYPLIGWRKCSEKFGRTKPYIIGLAKRLGVQVNKETTSKIKSENANRNFTPKINVNDFIKIEKPEVAYLLGLIWADGAVRNYPKHGYQIVISLLKTDFDKIVWIFDQVGEWSKYNFKRDSKTRNNKPQLTLSISGKILVDYLISKDYGDKSFKAPYKILETIPTNLKYLFFRGLLDGDGHISNTNSSGYTLCFCSGYDQDWGFLPKNFKITRQEDKLGNKRSYASLRNKTDVLNYCKYIYQNSQNDQMYLPRKYERYLAYKNRSEKWDNIRKRNIVQRSSSKLPSLVE